MVLFINVLRALAACLITNAHYTGIYPTDLIANGGLLGDVLFFAVSGYCLANIKIDFSIKGFLRWYGKRIWRIYPSVIIMTVIYMLLGFYQVTQEHNIFWWYFYPTYYHFVASIVVLYIPFFIIMNINILKENLFWIILGIMFVWLGIYYSIYDRRYYHIDAVWEPMIRFLFMESLLLGGLFRQYDKKYKNYFRIWFLLGGIIFFCLYFFTKLLFVRKNNLASYQFLNQMVLFVLLYFIFCIFAGLDKYLEQLPQYVKIVINFISSITLEIYIVQYVMIGIIRNIGLRFPLNWLVVTCSILISAWVLHCFCHIIQDYSEKYLNKMLNNNSNILNL